MTMSPYDDAKMKGEVNADGITDFVEVYIDDDVDSKVDDDVVNDNKNNYDPN